MEAQSQTCKNVWSERGSNSNSLYLEISPLMGLGPPMSGSPSDGVGGGFLVCGLVVVGGAHGGGGIGEGSFGGGGVGVVEGVGEGGGVGGGVGGG